MMISGGKTGKTGSGSMIITISGTTSGSTMISGNSADEVTDVAQMIQHSSTEATTATTFSLFLLRLVEQLDKEDQQWRLKIVLLIDGARYHTSQQTRKVIQQLQLCVIFTSPHSPQLMAVENMWGFIKSGNINPTGLKWGKR